MGAISDAFDRKLPIGWEFTISNEVYADLTGQDYEGIGVPVDLELDYASDRQTFFNAVAKNLEDDKAQIIGLAEAVK